MTETEAQETLKKVIKDLFDAQPDSMFTEKSDIGENPPFKIWIIGNRLQEYFSLIVSEQTLRRQMDIRRKIRTTDMGGAA